MWFELSEKPNNDAVYTLVKRQKIMRFILESKGKINDAVYT